MIISRVFHKDIPEYFITLGSNDGMDFPKDRFYFGAWKNKQLIGIVGCKRINDFTYKLTSDFVVKNYRGNGVYRKLNDHRTGYLLSIGVTLMKITCTLDSTPLHKGNGAVETRKFKKCTSFEYRYKKRL